MKTTNQIIGENLKKIRELSDSHKIRQPNLLVLNALLIVTMKEVQEKSHIISSKIFQTYSVVSLFYCLKIIFRRRMK